MQTRKDRVLIFIRNIVFICLVIAIGFYLYFSYQSPNNDADQQKIEVDDWEELKNNGAKLPSAQTDEQNLFYSSGKQQYFYDSPNSSSISEREIKEGEIYLLHYVNTNWFQNPLSPNVYAPKESFIPIQEGFVSKAKEDTIVFAEENGQMIEIGTINKNTEFHVIQSVGQWGIVEWGLKQAYVFGAGLTYVMALDDSQKSSPTARILIKENTTYKNASNQISFLSSMSFWADEINQVGEKVIIRLAGNEVEIQTTDIKERIEKTVEFKDQYLYEDLEKDLIHFSEMYPEIAELSSIGNSVEGRNLYKFTIGHGEKKILIDGAHHAREWITSIIIMKIIDDYLFEWKTTGKIDNYDLVELFNTYSIHVVPMVNPDGVNLTQLGKSDNTSLNDLVKMNEGSYDFTRWKSNIRGVDLNRNYPTGWEELIVWKSPYYRFYRGPTPLSEPETKAIYNLITNSSFEFLLNYHSSGELIFWNYKQTGEQYRRDQKFAKAVADFIGYSSIQESYVTNAGGLTDWFTYVIKQPSLTIELAPHIGETSVPSSYFNQVYQKTKYLPLFAIAYYEENIRNSNQ